MKQIRPIHGSAARKIAPLLLILGLAACGGGGPSKSEAEDAVNQHNAEMSGGRAPNVSVDDIDCTKSGDNQYTCTVLGKIKGEEKKESHKLMFEKINGKWKVGLAK